MYACSAKVDRNTEYVYYSVSSESNSFNPLYRMDIGSRDTTGLMDLMPGAKLCSLFLFHISGGPFRL